MEGLVNLAIIYRAVARRCRRRSSDVVATNASPWRLLARVARAVVLFAAPTVSAAASDRTVLLDFSCATYESARQVAMAGGWEHLAEKPSDCRFLMGQRIENRIATIVEILDVLQLPSGRWAQIGRVRRLFGPVSYSAGLADEYPVS